MRMLSMAKQTFQSQAKLTIYLSDLNGFKLFLCFNKAKAYSIINFYVIHIYLMKDNSNLKTFSKIGLLHQLMRKNFCKKYVRNSTKE